MGGHAIIMVMVGHPNVMMATTTEGPFMIVMVEGGIEGVVILM